MVVDIGSVGGGYNTASNRDKRGLSSCSGHIVVPYIPTPFTLSALSALSIKTSRVCWVDRSGLPMVLISWLRPLSERRERE